MLFFLRSAKAVSGFRSWLLWKSVLEPQDVAGGLTLVGAGIMDPDTMDQAQFLQPGALARAGREVLRLGALHPDRVTRMVLAARTSRLLGHLSDADVARATALIARARLPVEPPVLPVERWLELMGHDKKVEAGRLRFVLMKKLGQAYVDADVPTDVLSRVLSAPDAHV